MGKGADDKGKSLGTEYQSLVYTSAREESKARHPKHGLWNSENLNSKLKL